MNKTIKNILSILLTVVLATAIVGVVVLATGGSLTPSGSPAPTMVTLQDIYTRLTTGDQASEHSLSPSEAPGVTMATLQEIYNAIPTNDKVCEGTNGGTATCCEGGCGGGTLTWSNEVSGLCWDTDPDDEWNTEEVGGPYCDAGSLGGWLTTPNSTPVGAVEYCQYLNTAGTALTDSIGIWRLPTMSELLSSLSDQFIISPPTQTGFQGGTGYWSSSEGDSPYAWGASFDFGYVGSGLDGKDYQGTSFRCVH